MNKTLKATLEYNECLSLHKEYLQLCKYIYHNGVPLLKDYDVIDLITHHNGFYAEILRKGNNVVIVSRGSNDLHDYYNDSFMPIGKTPPQYYNLRALYNTQIVEMKKKEPYLMIVFIGHSLGGTLSQLMSMTTGDDAVTFAAFGGEGLLPDNLQRVDSNVINYGNEDDLIFASRLDKHIGEVRLVDVNSGSPHKLENWCAIDKYLLYIKGNNSHITQEDYLNIKDKRYFFEIIKKYDKSTDNVSDTDKKSECPGSYPVSGYVRSDGIKVSCYVRNCYKHSNGKMLPKTLHNLPQEEMEKWIRELI